jgi:hypothetical protein
MGILVMHIQAAKQISLSSGDLDGDQRIRGLEGLSKPGNQSIGLTHRPDRFPSTDQESNMNQLICAGAIAAAIFSNVGFAAAQQAPGGAHSDLTANQQQAVSQGLSTSPPQQAPAGTQPAAGNKLPDSMTAQSLPTNVTDQVPQVKNLLFVKLPDRIVLIDPDTKRVTEIVADEATTGSNTTGSNMNSSDRPSR